MNNTGKKAREQTLRTLFREIGEQLRRAGIQGAEYDARELLCSAFSLDTARFLLWAQEPLSSLLPDREERERRLHELLRLTMRRAERIPLQQLLGEVYFYGLRFRVSEAVLCPRQDTETLVDRVINDYAKVDKSAMSVLDLCTGSGCIGLSLLKCGGFPEVTAVDISEEALLIAAENAEALLGRGMLSGPGEKAVSGQSFRLLRSDLFSAFSEEERRFDIIASNPPYIESEEIRRLEPEVREHEPRLALDGGRDGLDFYRRIAGEAPGHLKPGGRIYLEIGYRQGEAVSELLRAAGFSGLRTDRDLGGNERVLSGRWDGGNERVPSGR